jgi:hypothetical protein
MAKVLPFHIQEEELVLHSQARVGQWDCRPAGLERLMKEE